MTVEHTERFVANVQYDDWKGTVVADDYVREDIREWLQNEGKLGKNDLLCGIQYHWVETSASLSVFIFEGHGGRKLNDARRGGKPIPLKKLVLELSLQDFLQKFKRLDLRLSLHGSIEGQEITITKVEDWQ